MTESEWQIKWLAQQGEIRQLREQVKCLQPFQDAYDDVCGNVLVIEQLQRAEKAEEEITHLTNCYVPLKKAVEFFVKSEQHEEDCDCPLCSVLWVGEIYEQSQQAKEESKHQ